MCGVQQVICQCEVFAAARRNRARGKHTRMRTLCLHDKQDGLSQETPGMQDHIVFSSFFHPVSSGRKGLQ